jgi:hypothetical protein
MVFVLGVLGFFVSVAGCGDYNVVYVYFFVAVYVAAWVEGGFAFCT